MRDCKNGCAIFGGKQFFNLNKGDYLFKDGNLMECIYFVRDGVIKMTKVTIDGNEKVLDLKCSGDYIGLVNILQENQEYSVSAEALTDCIVGSVSINEAKTELLCGNTCLLNKCLESASSRIRYNDELIFEDDISLKIISIFNYLYNKFGYVENDYKVIPLRITKSDIASMIGVRRETFSRKLSKLVESNVLKMENNKIIFLK